LRQQVKPKIGKRTSRGRKVLAEKIFGLSFDMNTPEMLGCDLLKRGLSTAYQRTSQQHVVVLITFQHNKLWHSMAWQQDVGSQRSKKKLTRNNNKKDVAKDNGVVLIT
jgi:hypothetical protein